MTRKVVTRAPHREVGVVNPAWLLDHAVEHESHLERRFIMVALACPVVLDIVHQPLQLTLVVDSGQGPTERKYTPDFRLTLADGTEGSSTASVRHADHPLCPISGRLLQES